MIVESKVDLEEERKVSVIEGRKLAKSMKFPFIQTSAKTRTNIEELFVSLYRRGCGDRRVFEMIETLGLREWKEEEFKLMPQHFREKVTCFLLVLKRSEGNEERKKERKLPKPLVKIILERLFQEERKTW